MLWKVIIVYVIEDAFNECISETWYLVNIGHLKIVRVWKELFIDKLIILRNNEYIINEIFVEFPTW